MSVNMTNLLKRDMDRYILNAYQEGATMLQRTSLESHSSLTSISNESVISWVKEKVTGIFRKFVVLVNKLIARFSKNREKLEANIQAYRENPEANVTLPMSPKAIKLSIVAVLAMVGASVAIVKAAKSGKDKKEIKSIMDRAQDNITKAKSTFKKAKGEKEESRTVKSKEAEEIAKEARAANERAEREFSKVIQEVTTSPRAESPEDVATAGITARSIAEAMTAASQFGAEAVAPAHMEFDNSQQIVVMKSRMTGYLLALDHRLHEQDWPAGKSKIKKTIKEIDKLCKQMKSKTDIGKARDMFQRATELFEENTREYRAGRHS